MKTFHFPDLTIGRVVEIDMWATANCPSYSGHETVDVSDNSLYNDIITSFTINTDEDAVWFALRWKK